MKKSSTKLWAGLFFTCYAQASTSAQSDIQARLRAEEARTSEVMRVAHMFSDAFGPRLTGSPQLLNAQKWAGETMKGWGLQAVALEPWRFGHQGWSNQITEVSVSSPYQTPILARALPWTPSTEGLQIVDAVLLAPPGMPAAGGEARPPQLVAVARAEAAASPMPPPKEQPLPPTREELLSYLEGMKAKVRGKAVLVGPAAMPPPDFTPPALRTPEEEWRALASPRSTAQPASNGPDRTHRDSVRLDRSQIHAEIAKFLAANGAVARVKDGGERRGLIRIESSNGFGETPQIPGVTIANSDYGRIARMLQDGQSVTMRVNVQNEFHAEGRTAYNLVAEIPGRDKKDEIVMLGAHLDGWATATGAADNAAGAAVMMEAMRLLQVSGLKPRRTIRIALWSGEEQGIFGSQAYVARHFGTIENPKPPFSKLSAYIELDNGTGKPRVGVVFGPPGGDKVVDRALADFRDWGFVGTYTGGRRPIGDSVAFYNAGLPSISFHQDPFDYDFNLHHTNFDTYEELYEPDLRAAAAEMAAVAYALAMDEEMFPRFGKHDVPPRDTASRAARVTPPAYTGEP